MQGLYEFFPERPHRFNEALAAVAAEASLLSYPGGDLSKFGRVQAISSDDVDVFVIRDKGNAIVVFRGSELSWRDWFRNLFAVGFHHQGQRIHEGFVQGIMEVYSDVRIALRGAKRVVVTGHSQGGALALLCAKQLIQDGWDVANVYTFGQPRVGDSRFCTRTDEVLRNRYFRVVYGNDPVPHAPLFFRLALLPLVPSPRRIRHTGQFVHISPRGGYALNPKLCQRHETYYYGYRDAGFLTFRHHSIAQYFEKCEGLRKCEDVSESFG